MRFISTLILAQVITSGSTATNPQSSAVRTVTTATDQATVADGDIKCNATAQASTESLPSAPFQGEELTYTKIDSSANACILSGNGNSIRNGSTVSTTYVLSTPGTVVVKFDNTDAVAKWTAK